MKLLKLLLLTTVLAFGVSAQTTTPEFRWSYSILPPFTYNPNNGPTSVTFSTIVFFVSVGDANTTGYTARLLLTDAAGKQHVFETSAPNSSSVSNGFMTLYISTLNLPLPLTVNQATVQALIGSTIQNPAQQTNYFPTPFVYGQ